MKSLAARIFAAIVLTNLLVSAAIGALFAAGFERRRAGHVALAGIVARAEGGAAARLASEGHEDDARAVLADVEARTGIQLVLHTPHGAIASSPLTPEASRVVSPALDRMSRDRGRERVVGDWVLVAPVEGDPAVVLAASYLWPPRGGIGFSPLHLQFVLVLVCAAIVSFALARWLSAPIRALRLATARVSAGDLSVRVAPSISRRADAEVRALAQDFDAMTVKVSESIGARERLLRDVSHELRSPLARLSIALEIAKQSAPEATLPALERIGRESERLEELVSLVLTMARLSDTSALLRVEDVHLDELVAEVLGDADYEARTTGRSVVSSPLAPSVVRADAELLRRALENVVRNALRFAPDGSAIEIALEARGDEVVFAVRDHGPGVPDDQLEAIFRPFARLSSARERGTGGAGLGLAIAERSVRLTGGRVRATNAEGGGLRVEIVLPTERPS